MRISQIKPGLIGKDGRTSAIERCLRNSPRVGVGPVNLSPWSGQPIAEAMANVLRRAREERPDFVIVGPEDPLAHGIVDALQEQLGIPCIGPTKALARLESSKAFTRELLRKHRVPGNPEHRVFHNTDGLEKYLANYLPAPKCSNDETNGIIIGEIRKRSGVIYGIGRKRIL